MIQNRETSWLSFNQRVLQEAQDKSVPLMQRLRFLGIFSNNLDEFIKVRMANIVKSAQLKGGKNKKISTHYTAKELLEVLNNQIDTLQKSFSQTYTDILTEMESKGIYVINETQLDKEQEAFCRNYFLSVISLRLVPLILRKSTKMPFLPDNNIYHAVKMYGKGNANPQYACIRIPVSGACPRFVELPSKAGRKDIIFLDDVIRLCLNDIFFMFKYEKIEAFTFKLVRDAELTMDDDISKSLIEKMEDSIENRLRGQPIRLIYDKEMPSDLLNIIASKLKLSADEGLAGGGRYHLMRDLMKFPKVSPELENSNPPALQHPSIMPYSSLLNVIRKKDIFLNYPYHTFNHFIDFLREAAIDPKVESIYITLYRTAESSKVINTLINAAKNGKNVVVLIELLARFDEEQNVEYTELLHREGVKVIHGIQGVKVHSKLVLIERKEGTKTKGYVYAGTGNFNEATAQIYVDYGLFTYNQAIVSDARAIFEFLLNTHKHFGCQKLLVAPYSMREEFKKMIIHEIKHAQKGEKAYIYAKFNSLTDEAMIKLLYKASQAGVEVRLIVRGAFCLLPQVKGVSDNIQAISIVDKYLEHARMVLFCNGGNEKVYILSADWMTRNLDYRVEVGIPILDKSIKETLKKVFNIQWNDNVKARDLSVYGSNNYVKTGKEQIRSQTVIYDYYKETCGVKIQKIIETKVAAINCRVLTEK
jgi:polyphosphate kinase